MEKISKTLQKFNIEKTIENYRDFLKNKHSLTAGYLNALQSQQNKQKNKLKKLVEMLQLLKIKSNLNQQLKKLNNLVFVK